MRKIFALALCSLMVGSTLTAGTDNQVTAANLKAAVEPVAADIAVGEIPPVSSSKESLDKSLEKVLLIVKGKITIPKDYSEFDYYLGAGYGQNQTWVLSWRRPSDSSSIRINCDQNGNIISYSKYDYSKEGNTVPNYLKKELKDTAEAFIKKIAPSIASKLEYINSTYEGVYSGNYSYTYQRKDNGVNFPDNYVVIGVDGVTGEVRSANIYWTYDTKVPSADIKLTKEEAAEIIQKNLNMKLVYRMNYNRVYDSLTGNDSKTAYLVYEPDQGYISVDAKTGKVYLTRSEWIQNDNKNDATAGAANESSKDMASASGMLTEEEIAKLTELEKLISKEKAIEIVTSNKSLYLDKNLITYNATLNKTFGMNQKQSNYVWHISLNDSRPVNYEKDKDTYRAYAYATVDANTGKILSFNASLKNNYDSKTGKWNEVKIKYDRKEAQNILESFLKAQVKDRFNKTKLVSQYEGYVAFYKEEMPIYGGYSFQYNRFNEEIEFPYNGIQGSVDGVTGKIYYFYSNWDEDIKFESPKKAMSAEEAFQKYISNEGFQLLYEVNEINEYDPNYVGNDRYYDSSDAYSMRKEIRLVYRPDVNPPYISPFTGKQLNYDGTEYEKVKSIIYTDIADTKENRNILLLADMNIRFEGDLFQPDKAITVGEFQSLFDQIGYWYEKTDSKLKDNSYMSREKVAFDMIQNLGFEKLAGLKGIYSTGYYDESSIKTEYIGAVALAKGLGLIEAEYDNYFNPKNNITRVDAVDLIMNFIRVKRDGVY